MVEYCKKLAIQYQSRPKQSWRVIEDLGTMNGGLNAGIAKVRCSNPNARGIVFIEKRFGEKELKHKIAHREIQLLHQISDHKNIVTMVDHFLNETYMRAALYLEFCDIGSLDKVVYEVAQGRHINERKVWRWFYQICNAIAYCHCGPDPRMSDDEILQSGWGRIYHRDIKPGNILLTREDGQIVAKLADFGCAVSEDYLAQEKNEQRAKRQQVGTKGYDAPEYPYFSGASDVWQLGVTIICVCTGIMWPWSNMNPSGERWDESRPAEIKYSRTLSSIIKLCLVRNPRMRSTAYQVLKALDEESVIMTSKLPKDEFPLQVFDPYDQQSLVPRHPGLVFLPGY
ncbi:hypothetical protein yc1106_07926 [Curvularia clavata]|uniref:non-specific serine/threonine protein kinase n=1 Tax=Curvularia clavata TaxID=95742 RepID=A0A9Q8ZCG2_CURCL|nr:hypothetical protein yc1106_07926 [Curvularia clavata]